MTLGQGRTRGDPCWRRADRWPGIRVAAVHLHRVRADVPARRHRRLSVPTDGAGGDLRHGQLVRAVAHAGADHGVVPVASAPGGGRGRPSSRGCVPQPS
ncbi:hypothetical protein G6F40_017637 [Rhizopus arrhizus]|nr:hypothetical protein G6F40_017637 [Rhizopus arrhizus]